MGLFSGKRGDDEPGTAAAPLRDRAEPSPPQSAASASGHKGTASMASIGKSITIQGDVSGDEDLVIDGTVDGKVELPDHQVTIGAHGTIRAELRAKSVLVIGCVTGNVHGSERVEIQATGRVEGDVTAPRLVIAEGGVVNGAIHMEQAAAAADGASRPASAAEDLRQLAG